MQTRCENIHKETCKRKVQKRGWNQINDKRRSTSGLRGARQAEPPEPPRVTHIHPEPIRTVTRGETIFCFKITFFC